jgi:hypothetical protein
MRRWLPVLAIGTAGVVLGAFLTLWLRPAAEPAGPLLPTQPLNVERDQAPTTLLAWVPRGLPAGFARAVAGLPGLGAVTVVAEDDVWLRRSWSDAGEVVDAPPAPYRIPIDAAAVDPATFASFVPVADRPSVDALATGQAILGATSAELRGLGPGGVLDVGGVRVRIAAIVPDGLIGAAEMVVSRRTGARIGIAHDRYVLVRPRDGRALSASALRAALRPLLPASLGLDRAVQVRAPGQTPFFRAGDAVLPPVIVKSLFGEFAARPGSIPGSLQVDPAWAATHLETMRVPLLGQVTCNRGILPQLRAAMTAVRARGLADTVTSFHGCFVPRHIGWNDANLLSYHSWGIAFDLNLATNIRGEAPHQDPRLVAILDRFGFQWGGTWIVPDGNHFEFHRAV